MTSAGLTAVLLNDTRVDHHHGCSIVIDRIHRLAAKHGIAITQTVRAREDWRKAAQLRDAIAAADLILVNGEGTIHHDAAAAEPLLAVTAEALTRDKPAFLINTTWHANSSAFQEMARSFDIISVRESGSQTELEQAGIESRVIPDLSLLTEFPRHPKPSGIAYTDCVVPGTAADLARTMWPLKAKPLSILYGRRSPKDMRRAFGRTRAAGNGDQVGLLTRGRIAYDVLRGQCEESEVFLQRLASYQLVITGRFHVMMLCMALRVPFLVVASNTHKNLSTLQDSGLGTWRHVNVADIDPALVARARDWDPGEVEALDNFIANARTAAEKLFSDIAGRSAQS